MLIVKLISAGLVVVASIEIIETICDVSASVTWVDSPGISTRVELVVDPVSLFFASDGISYSCSLPSSIPRSIAGPVVNVDEAVEC